MNNLTWLIEMGYVVYTKVHNGQTRPSCCGTASGRDLATRGPQRPRAVDCLASE